MLSWKHGAARNWKRPQEQIQEKYAKEDYWRILNESCYWSPSILPVYFLLFFIERRKFSMVHWRWINFHTKGATSSWYRVRPQYKRKIKGQKKNRWESFGIEWCENYKRTKTVWCIPAIVDELPSFKLGGFLKLKNNVLRWYLPGDYLCSMSRGSKKGFLQFVWRWVPAGWRRVGYTLCNTLLYQD